MYLYLNTTKLITITGIATMNRPSWVVPRIPATIQDGGQQPYWISKMVYLMKIFGQNFVQRCNTTVWRWPR